MNGYAELHRLDVEVRADMLETIAGYPDRERVERELSFALCAVDMEDPETLRWIAALCSALVVEYAPPCPYCNRVGCTEGPEL